MAFFVSFIVSALVSALVSVLGSAQDWPDRAAPYTGVQWENETPIVRVDGEWFKLVSIDEITAEELVKYCKQEWPSRWKKRVAEDLVEALVGMAHSPKSTVDLVLVNLETGNEVVRRDVPMTEENRRAAWTYNNQQPNDTPRPSKPKEISHDQALEDLLYLQELIETTYSYRDLNEVDVQDAIEEAADSLKDAVSVNDLGVQVMKILAKFGDGHTRLASSASTLPPGYLPLALASHGHKIVALAHNGNRVLDESFPYLNAIDGRAIQEWIRVVESIVPKGSPQLIRSMSLQRLSFLNFARQELGLESSKQVEITLESTNGKKTVSRQLAVATRPSLGRELPVQEAKIQSDKIAHLIIPRMDSGETFQAWLHQSMESFRETRGLIIDVRNNGGGSREALLTLLPYFMNPDSPPYVANVAAMRLNEGESRTPPDGYLADRFCYPRGWSGWSDGERALVLEFAKVFKPDWELPESEFSDWHYLVISNDRHRAPYHYSRPVVVLIDSGCFSATDIFAGAFSGYHGITLMGESTSGGSGRSKTHPLPNSGLRVRLSTIASFRPNGSRYDGLGVEPNIPVSATLDDLIGKTDSVLEAATTHIKRSR